ncbi:hypothetical protein ABZX75_02640 [Streptomyces sp. NPDC003038]|uniref:hypothetical protein n=1 Tax=unclassified Streptomyces TaxID=2593676 RepID=UPI0033B8F811
MASDDWILLAIAITPLVLFAVGIACVRPDPTACRGCGHLPADHHDGGWCSGDMFDAGELAPNGRSCTCWAYEGPSTS